ncbi:hypothetical protein CEXT_571001 [Caerostris extrusa]|uniref:Uncharacterized protein n=1 Tax=Caerostris extrusa TaxID=172846 RepID=A0AAV4VTC1_CAEEX|nr:hypothetical protein CEXT_571001 [Caerostris extrusa]
MSVGGYGYGYPMFTGWLPLPMHKATCHLKGLVPVKGLRYTLGSREMVSCNSFTLSGTFILIKGQLWSVRRPPSMHPSRTSGVFDLCGEACNGVCNVA